MIKAAKGKTKPSKIECLRALETKVLWLAAWMIHNANHLRSSRDGLKVGGHQASCASLVTVMTALYFDVLTPRDRVAVKPQASPVFHAIQYLLGNQSLDQIKNFRALGGAQSYPSRTKDSDDVDFSTGSVGLGVAMTSFAALAQDYVRLKGFAPSDQPPGRMIALVGDAELDEGNVYEAMLEGWKHDVRNVWWIIDYNRQSLDAVVTDRLFGRIDELFQTMGWRVVTLKYGEKLEAAFKRPGGDALRAWIDDCPNSLYSALVYKAGAGWRERLLRDIGETPGIAEMLADHDDDALSALMTNLAGHDINTIRDALQAIDDDRPTCIIAYTIKGYGLPFAGHKDNHAGIMNPDQMARFKQDNGVADGEEWDPYAALDVAPDELEAFLASVPFAAAGHRRMTAAKLATPITLPTPSGDSLSTQEGFGRILVEIARGGGELAERIVTTAPDVTVSTNLGGWVNRRGVFNRNVRADTFQEEDVLSTQRWSLSPEGQHIELGIAENNLFILLAALGLSHSLFGARLLPIGALYDPFIQRGLDALNYACYQDARFMVVATPSGITLAPEGGAHQSVATPLIGIAQDGIAAFEPAYVDEVATIMAWAFDYMQRDGSAGGDSAWLRDRQGGSVYLRLSTRPIVQPKRDMDQPLRDGVITGGYWREAPTAGAEIAIVYSGALATEAVEAHRQIKEDLPGAGLLAVTSADRLNAGWHAAERGRQAGHAAEMSQIEKLLGTLAPHAALITVIDGHPLTLAWMGAVYGHRVHPLGVEHFGQSGDLPDLYRHYRLDVDAILDAVASACLRKDP